jgi:phage pi2 protein 07
MNKEEAKKILKIMVSADGGCVYYARELFVQFAREFPEFKKLAEDIFKRRFNKDLFDIEFKEGVC